MTLRHWLAGLPLARLEVLHRIAKRRLAPIFRDPRAMIALREALDAARQRDHGVFFPGRMVRPGNSPGGACLPFLSDAPAPAAAVVNPLQGALSTAVNDAAPAAAADVACARRALDMPRQPDGYLRRLLLLHAPDRCADSHRHISAAICEAARQELAHRST